MISWFVRWLPREGARLADEFAEAVDWEGRVRADAEARWAAADEGVRAALAGHLRCAESMAADAARRLREHEELVQEFGRWLTRRYVRQMASLADRPDHWF